MVEQGTGASGSLPVRSVAGSKGKAEKGCWTNFLVWLSCRRRDQILNNFSP